MKLIIFFISIIFLASCSSIKPIGKLGPKKLGVFIIAHDDFLSANRMLVILDKEGNIAASTGGSVSGGGTVGLDAVGTAATAGSIVYGAKAIQYGLQNMSAKVKGIPKSIDVNANIRLHKLPNK